MVSSGGGVTSSGRVVVSSGGMVGGSTVGTSPQPNNKKYRCSERHVEISNAFNKYFDLCGYFDNSGFVQYFKLSVISYCSTGF